MGKPFVYIIAKLDGKKTQCLDVVTRCAYFCLLSRVVTGLKDLIQKPFRTSTMMVVVL
jgi:hypothetical protein